jgi:DNA-binding beta-propeller fold protein YncE
MFRRSLLLTLLLTGCAPTVATPGPTATVAAPTPLQAVAAYRLSATEPTVANGFSVLGISPPVSGRNLVGDRFMVRPATHEVLRLDAAGGLAVWGGLGAAAGRFNRPESLAVSLQHVYVADTNNHRLQVFNFDGTPSAQWGAFGLRPGQFVHPRSVEVLFDGQVVVTDDYRVQYFNPDGSFVVDVPIAMAARGEAAASEAAKAREAALSGVRAVLATLAADVRGLQGDATKFDAYASALQTAAAQASGVNLSGGAPFSQAVVAASLRMLVAEALPMRHVAATTGAGMIPSVGGTAQSIGGTRVSQVDIQGMDIETALMMVQSERAKLLEEQLKAQIAEVQNRNEQISKLNDLLSQLNAKRPAGTDPHKAVTRASLGDLAKEFPGTGDVAQADFDVRITQVKGQIDAAGNSQQMDMLRLQSMSNKRNEAFDVMTNFVKKMQESRASILGNMR